MSTPPEAGSPPLAPRVEVPLAGPERAAAPAASGHAARLAALRSNSQLLGVLVLAVLLYTCYFASSLILPVVMAAFFAMLLSPLMRRAPLRWLPRGVAALMLVAGLLGSLGAVGMFIAKPASEWAMNVPFVMREAAPKLKEMIRPLREATRASASFNDFTEDEDEAERVVVRPPRADLVSSTPRVLGSLFAVLLLTFSFLVYGDDVLSKLMSLRRTRAQKRLTADIVQQIQSDLSRYMLTISATSVVLGAATAAFLWYLGVEDPLLWGVLAAVLNLTPFIGPLVMSLLLALVGLSEFDTVGAALLPSAGFLLLHGIESQVLTPLVLGRTMKINPLAIILWLMLWGWLWGVVGLLVAVPMLVCLKIVASRVEAWQRWARILE
ncbi:AI-2E family transporter [Arenimonas sp. MALMAid1274]|uniref:AI-2E family transporter n=1 Tax=Arenimonas sp. MALMAid1274 TaxID=3411630 RepID=UPI003BA1A766